MFPVTNDRATAPLFGPIPHKPKCESAPAFVDDGRGLITVTGPNELAWWDAESGKPTGLKTIHTQPNSLRAVATTATWLA
jgi:hypothetical protein